MKLIARHADGTTSSWNVDHDNEEEARTWVGQSVSDETQAPALCVLALITNSDNP
jgi:hypothetical protein